MHRIPVFALALFLSTGWWGAIVSVTPAAKSGASMDPWGAAGQPTPPPTTESNASWDPWG